MCWRAAWKTRKASARPRAPRGALLLGVFMSPNHFAAGQRFFTEQNPG